MTADQINKLVDQEILVLDKVLSASISLHLEDSDHKNKVSATSSLDKLEGDLIRKYSLETEVPFVTIAIDLKEGNILTQHDKYTRKVGFYTYTHKIQSIIKTL